MLLRQRYHHLGLLFGRYQALLAKSKLPENKAMDISAHVMASLSEGMAYQSLCLDAINSWQSTEMDTADKGEATYQYQRDQYLAPFVSSDHSSLRTSKGGSATPLPTWMTSSLVYLILEDELSLSDKRRIVNLAASDYLYGSDNPDKCVFMAIEWDKDYSNVIKVRSQQHIWETSFQELGSSWPLEVINLFANNEVWAEGSYTALA